AAEHRRAGVALVGPRADAAKDSCEEGELVAARVTEVRDAAAAAITAALADPGEATVISRYVYDETDFELGDGERKVVVLAEAYANNGPVRREDDEWDYTVAVLIAERYPAAGAPTEAWTDERVAWVEATIVRVLDDSGRGEPILDKLRPQTAEVLVYDPDLLR